MKHILALDPSIKALGWALFSENGELIDAGLIRTPTAKMQHFDRALLVSEQLPDISEKIDVLVMETPVSYSQGAKGDSNLLQGMVFINGFACSKYKPTETVFYKPAQWKGQVPKKIHNKRVLAKLDEKSLQVLNNCTTVKSELHNVIDAVGIGLFYIERKKK